MKRNLIRWKIYKTPFGPGSTHHPWSTQVPGEYGSIGFPIAVLIRLISEFIIIPHGASGKHLDGTGGSIKCTEEQTGKKESPKIKCTTVHTRAHDRVHTVDSLCVSSLQLFLPSGKVVAVRRAENSENSLPSPLRVQAGWITLAPDVIAVPPLGRSEVKCRPPFPRGHTHTHTLS